MEDVHAPKAPAGQDLTVLWTVAQPVVRSYVRSMVRDVHVTEDLLQQVALTLVEKFEQYDRGRNFTAWCMGISRNKVMNYLSTHSRDRHRFGSEAMERVAEAYISLEDENLEREIALEECLRHLQGRARKAIAMRFEQGLQTAAIAAALGMAPTAMRVLLHRTRNQLAECINGHLAGKKGLA